MKKTMLTICLIFVVASAGCTSLMPHPRPWTKREKIAATFFVVAHTVNAFTTEAHQDYPDMYYEMNPILGRHPSDMEIGTYFSLTGVATLLVTHLYPELREPVLYGYGGVNCYWAIHDYQMLERDGNW